VAQGWDRDSPVVSLVTGPLVRGLSDLKKEEPFQLPLWEVLTQYFFTRRPLEWLLPVKLAQNEVAVDP
jgi:hypothetical protein